MTSKFQALDSSFESEGENTLDCQKVAAGTSFQTHWGVVTLQREINVRFVQTGDIFYAMLPPEFNILTRGAGTSTEAALEDLMAMCSDYIKWFSNPKKPAKAIALTTVNKLKTVFSLSSTPDSIEGHLQDRE